MFYQPVDPAKVLDRKFDKEDFRFYVRVFLPFVIFMFAIPVIYLIPRVLSPDADIKALLLRVAGMTGSYFILLAIMIVYLIIFSSIGRNIYKKQVNKYGYDNLVSQLIQPDNVVSFIHPLKYESYVIVTKEFFVLARTKIIRLDEIRQMKFERNTKGNTSRPFNIANKSPFEVTRFIRKVHIAEANGKNAEYPVALTEEEYYALVNFMAYRLGPNMVYII
ncbi:MAG: hypothetical protein K5881_04945 [Saccharofermentans sp.]|nr:hypothetical protein [Saccharofermentans sp.]